MLEFKSIRHWDSKLEFTVNIEEAVNKAIEFFKDKIKFDPITCTTSLSDNLIKEIPLSESYKWRTDGVKDYTCIAKGLFIKKVKFFISDFRTVDWMINFGGDIACHLKNQSQVQFAYSNRIKFLIKEGNIFCSTNAERPNHIPNAERFAALNFVNDSVRADLYATQSLVAKEVEDSTELRINFDGKIENKTYIASPFFCETDIEIRDSMLRAFTNYVRPDLLNPNIEGDLNKDKVLAQKIKDDNTSAIDDCSTLVFPKNTTDLGTLYEVGYAIRKGKLVIRYDHVNDIYEVLVNPTVTTNNSISKCTLDLNKLGSGILLGYHYDRELRYYLGSSRDNIMLMNDELIENPTELYPSYQEDILSDSVYRLNTLTSGS